MEQYKIDKGIYNFFIKKGLSVSEMRRILALYALSKGIKRPKKFKNNIHAMHKWYSEISIQAQAEFTAFKKLYNENKIVTRRKDSYDDWYDEYSMDGSFAYNGVADDF